MGVQFTQDIGWSTVKKAIHAYRLCILRSCSVNSLTRRSSDPISETWTFDRGYKYGYPFRKITLHNSCFHLTRLNLLVFSSVFVMYIYRPLVALALFFSVTTATPKPQNDSKLLQRLYFLHPYIDYLPVVDDITSGAASVFGDVTSVGGSIIGDITSGGRLKIKKLEGEGLTSLIIVAASIFTEVTSVGGQAFTVVTSVGGQALTLATEGAGIVTSFAGAEYTALTDAAASLATAANSAASSISA